MAVPTKSLKTALLGAAGGIGQPLALLLKQSSTITELSLFDIVPIVKGVAADLSHINTPSIVTAYTRDDDGLKKALEGADIVVIPAGIPRKPGMTRDDLFKINAGIVRDLATGIAQYCPKAFVCIISNPVNSTVPIVAEVLKKAGVFDPKKLFGVTTLDVVRASTFAASAADEHTASAKYKIPVIGGHSGVTILPLLSQSNPPLPQSVLGDEEKVKALVNRIQFGGDEVVEAKDGAGSATLSMAFAGYRFVESLINSKYNSKPTVEFTYIYLKDGANVGSESVTSLLGEGVDFFSVPVELGPEGVEKILPLGQLNAYEEELLKAALPELKGNIAKGVGFVDAKL